MGKNQKKKYHGFSRARQQRAETEFRKKEWNAVGKLNRQYERLCYGEQTGGTIALFGSSNIRRLNLEKVAREFAGREVIRYGISGATSFELKRQVDALILQNQIEAIIIHGGTNDVWGPSRRHPVVSKDRIAQDIFDTALKCRRSGVRHVFISGIGPINDSRRHNADSQELATAVNELVEQHCYQREDIHYIDNS